MLCWLHLSFGLSWHFSNKSREQLSKFQNMYFTNWLGELKELLMELTRTEKSNSQLSTGCVCHWLAENLTSPVQICLHNFYYFSTTKIFVQPSQGQRLLGCTFDMPRKSNLLSAGFQALASDYWKLTISQMLRYFVGHQFWMRVNIPYNVCVMSGPPAGFWIPSSANS